MDANPQDVTLTYNYLILDTMKRMRDAQAEGQRDKYVIYFEYGLQQVIPYLDEGIRRKIEEAFQTLKEEIKRIKKEEQNEVTRNKAILEIKESFADAHRYYINLALTKVGIVKISEEGVIDFTSTDFDTVKKIVRSSGRGLEAAIDENVKGDPNGKK